MIQKEIVGYYFSIIGRFMRSTRSSKILRKRENFHLMKLIYN